MSFSVLAAFDDLFFAAGNRFALAYQTIRPFFRDLLPFFFGDNNRLLHVFRTCRSRLRAKAGNQNAQDSHVWFSDRADANPQVIFGLDFKTVRANEWSSQDTSMDV
jgi:hypothetical protein